MVAGRIAQDRLDDDLRLWARGRLAEIDSRLAAIEDEVNDRRNVSVRQ